MGSLTVAQLNSLINLSTKAKSGLVYNTLNEWIMQEKNRSQRLRQQGKKLDNANQVVTDNLDSNNLPQDMVNRLEGVCEKARQSNNLQQLSKTRQDIVDTFFCLSHLYALSSTTHNRVLRRNTEQALTQLLINHPLHVINAIQFSTAQKKQDLQEQLGLSVEIMALFVSYLTPDAIYSAGVNNLVDNFFRDFNTQVEFFKKQGNGEISHEHMIRLIAQVNYLIQLNYRLPDNEDYKVAKAKLHSLVNSCCKAVPELGKQLNIAIPNLSFDPDWASAAGAEKKYAQSDILGHYKKEINELNTDYVALVKDTTKTLVSLGTDYHASLKNINDQVKRYQLTLEHIKNSTDWVNAYQSHFVKFDTISKNLRSIVESCQAEYNTLIEREKELKKNFNAEVNKIAGYKSQFLELTPEEEELNNTYNHSLKIIEARKQVLQSSINDIQKVIPSPEVFKKAVIDTIEAEMLRMLSKDGEKDQLFEKLGGDIFNSRAALLKELEQLSTQPIPDKVKQHSGKLVLDHRVKDINRSILILQGTGLDAVFKKKTHDLVGLIENNNLQLSDVMQAMDRMADDIKRAKEQPIPVGSTLDNTKVIELEALKKLASPDSPSRRELEVSQNLDQLDEQPAYYDKATALIHDRNNEIAKLQAEYESLKQRRAKLEKENQALFDKLANEENALKEKVSSIDLLNQKSRDLRKDSVAETDSIDSLFNQITSSKTDAKQSLIELATKKNNLVANIKQDKSNIVDENGVSVSELPNDLEQDAVKSFDLLENRAEKLFDNQKNRAEQCIALEQELQHSMKQKQATRVSVLNKIPATFQQYCAENEDKNFDQCIVDYDNQLKEMDKKFNKSTVTQRKENREQAVSKLNDFYKDNALIAKDAIDEVGRLNERKNHVVATLQKQSTDLDKTVKATVGGTAGGAIIGALTGAVTGFVIGGGPIGAVIGLIAGFTLGLGVGGGAGFLAGHKLPLKPASYSLAASKQPTANNKTNSNDDDTTSKINNLFANNKIPTVNPISSMTATNRSTENEQEELSIDNFDDYFLGKDHGFKPESTVSKQKGIAPQPQKVSGVPGTVFNQKPSTNVSSPEVNNAPKKNTFKS